MLQLFSSYITTKSNQVRTKPDAENYIHYTFQLTCLDSLVILASHNVTQLAYRPYVK